MAESREDTPAIDVVKLLGATRLVRRGQAPSTELRAAVRKGLPFYTFESLLKAVDLPQKQLAGVLGIPDRTVGPGGPGTVFGFADSSGRGRLIGASSGGSQELLCHLAGRACHAACLFGQRAGRRIG